MSVDAVGWLALAGVIAVLLALDPLVLHRRPRDVSVREALAFAGVHVAVALVFAAVLAGWYGGGAATRFLTGYALEKTLSVDNVLVLTMVLAVFRFPAARQRHVLVGGLAAAIVLRGGLLAAGTALFDAAHAVVYAFGGFLVVMSLRMTRRRSLEHDPAASRLVSSLVRATRGSRGLAAVVAVAAVDLVFALDSIPAILAVTNEPFLVFAANAFALLGLGELYFVLRAARHRFAHLDVAVAILLGLAGLKLLLADVWHVPPAAGLLVVLAVLGTFVARSGGASRPAARPRRAHP